jgi:hypothetical protein
MKISEVVNKIKVCDIIINNNNSDRRLWDTVWNTECPSNILSQENGRCYFIVVNEDIYKIGYSDCLGGIKSTIDTYKSSGNSGRPSDRTHGIHILIAEELLKGNKVEVYFTYNPTINFELLLMDGSTKVVSQSLSGKILETENMSIYISKEGKHPIWNLQEAGKPWPSYLQESRNTLLAGTPANMDSIKNRLGIK